MNFQSLVELAPWTTIAQICNLLIQIVLFKKFLFQPIKNIIAKEAKAAYETHLKTASEEAKAITTRAISSANLASEQIVSTAKAEADAMREKASREIELERRKTMDELKGEISGLAVEIASKVAEKEIGEKEHEALIGKFIDELGEGS